MDAAVDGAYAGPFGPNVGPFRARVHHGYPEIGWVPLSLCWPVRRRPSPPSPSRASRPGNDSQTLCLSVFAYSERRHELFAVRLTR
ncbi:CRAL/TRIO domain [Musa troglodytarum]|uniref:CRAL/TRIO domain n=1 Tax=Musa troglodytarum TaxID=320322 RepID=A0A9E7K1Q2_9LILI|nr:CRAL/TRIO domain [Musa troglodytarum]URE05373.1 CRAL/TRIO domain [Musa troglodytarum]